MEPVVTTANTVYSCVVDQNARSPHQAFIWVSSLLGYGGQQPESLVVHIVRDCHPNYKELFDSMGVRTVIVEPFDPGPHHANKLIQLESEAARSADYVVICDCDLAFCDDISPHIAGDAIGATVSNDTSLPLNDWRRIFDDANLPFGTLKAGTVYGSGGLLVLPQKIAEDLRSVWPKWYQWLLDRSSGSFTRFAEQVSFVLSLAELGLIVDRLDREDSFLIHLPLASPTLGKGRPKVVHYHEHLNESGFLLPTRMPSVDAQINRINDLIATSRRQSFDNFTFWEFRYALHPSLGSGVGSRGGNLSIKRDILKAQLKALRPDSVLDVGCGDLEVMKDLTISNYTGIDVSPSAIELAKKKRPDWEFRWGDILKLDLDPKDLVINLDVVIHQPTREIYEAFCEKLLSLSRKFLIVAGYDRPPRYASEITFYYEPLSETLTRLARGRVEIVGSYRDTTILRWSRTGSL